MFGTQTRRWCIMTPVTHLVFFLLLAYTGSADGNCHFPKRWEGRWFQLGLQTITIKDDAMAHKGTCIENSENKHVMNDKKDNCYFCLVIHEKHPNVLQYKESYCLPGKKSIEEICSRVVGDGQLLSMFRMDSQPVACPFHGSFTFTYDRGGGKCASPVSRIDACTEDSRLSFRYQACPDVQGSESVVEQLVCLATWKEGSLRYMLGKMDHPHASKDEDRYRCFVYDRLHGADRNGFQVAQSADATCGGIASSKDGSRTMTLTKMDHHETKCHFPPWVTSHRHWHTLDYKKSYQFNHKNTTVRVINDTRDGLEKRVICHEEVEVSDRKAVIVTHITMGCHSGYVCMHFYKREGHVIELQEGKVSAASEDACHPIYFKKEKISFTTLITASPQTRKCPYHGKYMAIGVSREGLMVRDMCLGSFSTLVVGCSQENRMEFHSTCTNADTRVTVYSCYGSWEENDTNFLIASPMSRSSKDARRLCFIYSEISQVLRFSSIAHTCDRNITIGVGGSWSFNVTSNGQCTEALPSTNSCPEIVSSVFILVSVLQIAVIR